MPFHFKSNKHFLNTRRNLIHGLMFDKNKGRDPSWNKDDPGWPRIADHIAHYGRELIEQHPNLTIEELEVYLQLSN